MSSRHTPSLFPEQDEPSAVEKRAAHWVLLQQKGLSAKEERDFRAWLLDPRHRAVYAEMAETSHLLDGLKFGAPEGTIPFEPETPLPTRTFPWRRVALIAACFTLIGIFGWRQLAPRPDTFAATVTTEVGGLRAFDLPDGSVIHLNTDSAIRVAYLPHERRLTLLRGEAYFTVAKNPERPFWVEAGPVAVRAVGTAFNVRLQPDAVNVVVTEGKVRVVDGDGRAAAQTKSVDDLGPLLTVGHMGKVPMSAKPTAASESMVITATEPQALKSVLAWQKGRLEFFDQPLDEVVAEFNRYNSHKIVIVDPALGSHRFGGGFTSHGIAPLIEVLEQNFHVVAEERGNETFLRASK